MPADHLARFAHPGGGAALHDHLVREFAHASATESGTGFSATDHALNDALIHLAGQVDGVVTGMVPVLASQLHLLLALVTHQQNVIGTLIEPAGRA